MIQDDCASWECLEINWKLDFNQVVLDLKRSIKSRTKVNDSGEDQGNFKKINQGHSFKILSYKISGLYYALVPKWF